MGLFEAIFGKKEPQAQQKWTGSQNWETLTAYSPTFYSRGGSLYEFELVRMAIDARARHISKLKPEIIGAAHPELKTQIKSAPNSFQTWSQYLYRLSTILDMQNTAFIVPVLDKYGRTNGFYPVLPTMCTPVQHDGVVYLRYQFRNGKKAAIEFDRCGIMTKFQYEDDLYGTSNNAMKNTTDLLDINKQGVEEAVKNSAIYRFMAQVNNFTKVEDLKKERERFTEENFRSDSKGGVLLFPNTYTNIQQVKSTPYTVDKDEIQLIKDSVFGYFAVNEDIIQSKASSEVFSSFYEGVVEVFALQASEVHSKMVFTTHERNLDNMIMFTANRLQYMSNTEKLSVSEKMADRGLMSINEIREIWNLPPIEGGDRFPRRGEYYFDNEGGQGNE